MLFPGGPARSVVVAVTLVETTGLLASSSETTRLAVLVDGLRDPVDPGIPTDLCRVVVSITKNPGKNLTHTALWLGSTRMTS